MGSGIVSMGLILREGGSKSPCRWVTSSGIYIFDATKDDNLFIHFKDGYRLSFLKTPQTSLKAIFQKPLKKLKSHF